MKQWLTLTLLLFAQHTSAQLFSEPLTVHPSQIVADQPFLILIESQWNDTCGGEFEVSVSREQIDVTAILLSPSLGPTVCAGRVTPFIKLINPRDFAAADFAFGASLTVRYLFDQGNGPELVSSKTVDFSTESGVASTIQNGGWTTPTIERSGLFIDQQRDVLTAALFDYDENGQPFWTYAAGPVNGNVFAADQISYNEIECITQPCPRVAEGSVGRVNMLLRGTNELIVDYRDVLRSGTVSEMESFAYQRFEFNRDPALVDAPAAIPDLAGEWLAGAGPKPLFQPQYEYVQIGYTGLDNEEGLPRHRFQASRMADGLVSVPAFEIIGVDQRPVDGPFDCAVVGLSFDDVSCDFRFELKNAGLTAVTGSADCGNLEAVPFQMRKL